MGISKNLKLAIKEAWDNKCAYCEMTAPLEIDHVVPSREGGTDHLGNLVPSCRQCNLSKSGRRLHHLKEFQIIREAKDKEYVIKEKLSVYSKSHDISSETSTHSRRVLLNISHDLLRNIDIIVGDIKRLKRGYTRTAWIEAALVEKLERDIGSKDS